MSSTLSTLRHTLRTEHPNVLLSYALTVIRTASFLSGNWIFFWLRFMTYGQLGIVDAFAFGFGLIAEIPTGAVSDMIGRRKTMAFGMLLVGVGFTIEGFSGSMGQLVFGFLIAQVGWAFMSGADEALVYDSLKERGEEGRYDRVASINGVLGMASLIGSALIGAVMYRIDPGMPHYAWGILHLAGFFLALRLTEPQVKGREPFSMRLYVRQLSNGFRHLVGPALRAFLPIAFGLLGIVTLMRMSLVQPAIAATMGFDADAQAVIFALQLTAAALVVGYFPQIRRRLGEWWGLSFVTALMIVGFMGVSAFVGVGGVLALILIRVAGDLAAPWVSVVMNNHIPSKDRATTLSTVALLSKLPYVLTAIIAGDLAQTNQLGVFNLGVIIFLVLMLGLSLSFLFLMSPLIAITNEPHESSAVE